MQIKSWSQFECCYICNYIVFNIKWKTFEFVLRKIVSLLLKNLIYAKTKITRSVSNVQSLITAFFQVNWHFLLFSVSLLSGVNGVKGELTTNVINIFSQFKYYIHIFWFAWKKLAYHYKINSSKSDLLLVKGY